MNAKVWSIVPPLLDGSNGWVSLSAIVEMNGWLERNARVSATRVNGLQLKRGMKETIFPLAFFVSHAQRQR